ncbi:MAG: helix-turn-helix domain-containing protein [Alphaproteobacteria bacterium]|nr:helix-turn-helix domain-containing protein [Alphaproteobacteria bacterium]
MLINAAQCRAARAMLAWSRDVLTERSHVSKRTIVDFERGARSPHASTLFAIQTAFETAGITFIEEEGEGVGIKLRRNEPA